MNHEYSCTKKDKRLLVLLALGLTIVFSNIAVPLKHTPVYPQKAWLEIQRGENRNVFRIDLNNPALPDDMLDKEMNGGQNKHFKQTVQTKLRKHKIVSIRKDERKNLWIFTNVSPSLAFLLGQPFSINHATAEELILIPGIGEATAASITEHRDNFGPIGDIRQLERVPGIGQKTSQRIQKYFIYDADGK